MSENAPTDRLHQTDAQPAAGIRSMTAGEMLHELIRGGYIVPELTGYGQPTMPSAYRPVPSITTAHTTPAPMRTVEN